MYNSLLNMIYDNTLHILETLESAELPLRSRRCMNGSVDEGGQIAVLEEQDHK
jgi:hypothetical protein